MNETQTLQQGPTNSIQQSRNDLQPSGQGQTSQQFKQEQLVAPELKVGNSTVQPSGTNKPGVQDASGGGFPMVPFLAGVVLLSIIAALLWRWWSNQDLAQVAPVTALEPETLPEAKPTKSRPKKANKNRPKKHKKSKTAKK